MSLVFNSALLGAALVAATPLILAATGGMLSHQVGLFNFTLEGLMLFGAFFGVLLAITTGQIVVAVLGAMIVSCLISLLFASIVLEFDASPVIAALGVNVMALGATSLLVRSLLGHVGGVFSPIGLTPLDLPVLRDIPFVRDVLNDQTVLTYVAIVCGPIAYLIINRTVVGLHIRSVGDNPEAASAAGINVRGVRYLALAGTGALCGLAGVQLSLGFLSQFTDGITAGRGLIAFAAVVFGGNRPLGAYGAAMLFGFADALGNRLQGLGIPGELVVLFPYVLAIAALCIAGYRARLSGVEL